MPDTSRNNSLEQRLLPLLERLNSTDTRLASQHTLLLFVKHLDVDSVPGALDCLCQVDRNQKPMARAFVAELLGHLCTRMKHDLSPHTPRVLHALLKHLGDADARVREATAQAIARLVRDALPLTSASLDTVFKGLFHLMATRTPPTQAAAARALSQVLLACPVAQVRASLERLTAVLARHLTRPGVQCDVLERLIEVVGALEPHQSERTGELQRAVIRALDSPAWRVRLAAADALGRWAVPSGVVVDPAAVLSALEPCRFDRIPRVRQAAGIAMHRWRALQTDTERSALALAPNASPAPFAVAPREDRTTPASVEGEPFPVAVPVRAAPSDAARLWRKYKQMAGSIERLSSIVEDGFTRIETRLAALEAAKGHESSLSRATTSNGGPQGDWARISSLYEAGRVDDAFEVAFAAGDDLHLVRLMGRAEPCMDRIASTQTWATLLARIGAFLDRGVFVDNVTPWIRGADDLVQGAGGDGLDQVRQGLHRVRHVAGTTRARDAHRTGYPSLIQSV